MCRDDLNQRQQILENAARMFNDLRQEFLTEWHWFSYHAQIGTPFMQTIAASCQELDRISPDAPRRMMRELANIRGRERDQDQYDQLLQKLSEILVMQQVVRMPWPEGTNFGIECSTVGSPKHVDFVVSPPGGMKYGFEVKSPAHLTHRARRGQGGVQIPARGPDGLVELAQGNEQNVVLPRDNTIRDFLRSANDKFSAFKCGGDFVGILVIVWDDFIYEAIAPLVNERNGLLTDASYSRTGDGPETYMNVDGILLLRHISYFVTASAEQPLPDQRLHAMHVGGPGSLPNVLVEVPEGHEIPRYIVDEFNAVPYTDEWIQRFADYNANEYIIWV